MQPQPKDWTHDPLPDPARFPVGHQLAVRGAGYQWIYRREPEGWRFVVREPDPETEPTRARL